MKCNNREGIRLSDAPDVTNLAKKLVVRRRGLRAKNMALQYGIAMPPSFGNAFWCKSKFTPSDSVGVPTSPCT